MEDKDLQSRISIANEFSQKFDYADKMEGMKGEKLRDRIQAGMDFPIPHRIEPVPYLGIVEEIVEYTFDELVARCPVTGIKDHYKVTVRFIPDKLIPELKSLKLYYWDFEEFKVPISHEHLAAKIYTYFVETLKPKSSYLKLDVAGRGELFTTVQLGSIEEFGFLPDRVYKNM